jgi:FkbM family methyltransferase
MKELLKSLPVVGALLKAVNRARWNFRVWQLDPGRNIRKALIGCHNLSVVQIGSNDGKSDDPIHELLTQNSKWKALLVEPIPFLFERLKQNYQNRAGLSFANVAIGETEGTMTFYYLESDLKNRFPDLPAWFDQLGSFNPDHIVKHLGEHMRPWITTLEIATLPFPKLLSQHSISQFDVLHIDTEGHDWKILRQLDLTLFRPRVILFEYKHLSESDRKEAFAHLQRFYRIKDLSVNGDYLCFRLK